MTATVALQDVAEVVRGVSFDKTDATSEPRADYVPILRAGNIDSTLLVEQDLVWVPERKVGSSQRMQPWDIAICMSSGSPAVVGKTAVLRVPWVGSVGAFCAIIRPNPAKIVPEFLGYFLQSKTFRAWTRQSSGANIKNIRKSELESFGIPLPPLSEQRRIVDLLARAEGIVRLRRAAQKKAQAIIPALFLDMFGDPATNSKGLAVVTLGEVLASADYGSSSKASDADVGLPMIRMGNVDYSGNVDLTDLKFVNLPAEDVVRFGLKDGDLLFNRTNSKELVGKTGIWIGDRQAILASYFIRLRVSEQMVRPFFVWAFMNTLHMKRILVETARGAIGQANINSRELRAFRIPLPNLDEQVRFESRCRDVLALRAQQGHAIEKAEATFSALLARLLGGGPVSVAASSEEAAVA